MKNLAENIDCDYYIRKELMRARIEIIENAVPSTNEVPAKLTGKLGPFTFDRAWYYWRVHGPMPIVTARELYLDPVGKDDIRVAGYAGNTDPDGIWANHYDSNGVRLISDPDGSQEKEYNSFAERFPGEYLKENTRFVRDIKAETAVSYIESYHIDSEVGLRIFADAIRKLIGL